jgi:hypothetical protein
MSSRLARSIHGTVLGKCTDEVKTKVPGDDKEDFDRYCRSVGTTAGELLRDFILTKTRGVEFVRSLYERRMSVVSAMGPGEAPVDGGGHD